MSTLNLAAFCCFETLFSAAVSLILGIIYSSKIYLLIFEDRNIKICLPSSFGALSIFTSSPSACANLSIFAVPISGCAISRPRSRIETLSLSPLERNFFAWFTFVLKSPISILSERRISFCFNSFLLFAIFLFALSLFIAEFAVIHNFNNRRLCLRSDFN